MWKTKIFASSLRRAQLRRPGLWFCYASMDCVFVRILWEWCQHVSCHISHPCIIFHVKVYPNIPGYPQYISHTCPITRRMYSPKKHRRHWGVTDLNAMDDFLVALPLENPWFSVEGGREAEGAEGREREAEQFKGTQRWGTEGRSYGVGCFTLLFVNNSNSYSLGPNS